MRWRNAVNAFMGLWIIISPWTLRVSHQGNVLASCVIGGVALCLVSIWGAAADNWSVWGFVISVASALWFVFQPFLGHYTNGGYWEIVVPGIVSLFLDFWTWISFPTSGFKNGSGTRT